MVFEAHYTARKQIILLLLGGILMLGGLWIAFLPAGSFDDSRKIVALASLLGTDPDTVGFASAWIVALLGMAVFPKVWQQVQHSGPAIRLDRHAIHWHAWSSEPIPWRNIESVQSYSVNGQKMIGLTFCDPSLNRGQGLKGVLASLNAMTGFGHASITAQSMDKSHDELFAAISEFLTRYGRNANNVSNASNHVGIRAGTFGLRQR